MLAVILVVITEGRVGVGNQRETAGDGVIRPLYGQLIKPAAGEVVAQDQPGVPCIFYAVVAAVVLVFAIVIGFIRHRVAAKDLQRRLIPQRNVLVTHFGAVGIYLLGVAGSRVIHGVRFHVFAG